MKFLDDILDKITHNQAEPVYNRTSPLSFKRRYLIRLAVTAAAFVIIPLIVWFILVFNRSYHEIINAREDYYREITRNFGVSFQRKVSEFYTTAIQISVDTRSSRNNSSILTSAAFSRNPYYYTECIRALARYSQRSGLKFGIYFPDDDCLFTDSNKYTADSFIANNLFISEPKSAEKIKEFFKRKDSYMIYCSTFLELGSAGELMLGIPVKLGIEREDALIFFVFDGSFIDPVYEDEQSLAFCVFDNAGNELLYSSGTYFPDSPDHQPRGSRIFLVEDNTVGQIYLSVVPFDRITGSLFTFIAAMKKMGIAAFFGIFIIIALMVYLDYKPVENFSNEMSKRNQLTLDLILGHILYGLPIRSNEAEELGLLPSRGGGFCVIVLFEVKFPIDILTVLSNNLSSRFGIKSYSTDILYREHSVIVCLLPSHEITGFNECIETVIGDHGHFEIGPVVNKLIEIKDSYETCLAQNDRKDTPLPVEAAAEPSETKTEKINAEQGVRGFKKRMLNFVEEQFNNPKLSLIFVADYFGISIYSVSRFFSNEIGVGFSEFVTAKRMALAQTLLLSTEKEIVEIASAVGLPNVNYFSRLFKSFYGMIPTKYRNETRQKKE